VKVTVAFQIDIELNELVNVNNRDSGRPIAKFLWPFLIVGVVVAAFSPGFRNDFVNWDDEKIIVNNSDFRGLGWTELKWMFSTVYMCHYQPLGWLSYSVDYAIWGLDPRGFFLTNLLIHSATALCFYFLSRRLLGMVLLWSPSEVRFGAAVATIFFAVHPLRVESVVWLSERRDVLSGFFLLVSVLCYVRFAERSQARRAWYCAALISFAASLMSKATGVGLPLVLLLLDWYPFGRWRSEPGRGNQHVSMRLLLEKVPFVLMAAVTMLVAIYAQQKSDTLSPLAYHGVGERLLVAAYALVFYVKKTILPWGLSPLVPIPTPDEIWALRFGATALLVTLAAAALVAIRRRWPAGTVIAVAYFVLLLPVLGIVQIGPQLVADRYSYLSCLGLAILVGTGMIAARKWLSQRAPETRILLDTAAILVMAALVMLTRAQAAVWRNSETLWTHVLKQFPNSDIAHVGIATVLGESGRLPEAVFHLQRAVKLRPTWPEPHYDLGVALLALGRPIEASESLQNAVQLMPRYAEAWNNLGASYLQLGQFEKAVESLERAVELTPDNGMSMHNLAQSLAFSGRAAEAIAWWRRAVDATPDSPIILEALALHLAASADDSLRDGPLAVRLAQQACKLTNDRAATCIDALAAAYAEGGDFELAAQTAARAAERARKAGDTAFADDVERRRELYLSRQPYRIPPAPDH
jgi:Flp pilus assembly protein TadD